MSNWYNDDCHAMMTGQHLRELRAEAAHERQARQLSRRCAGPVRVQLGRLLIIAGEALARQPIETVRAERA